MDIAQTLLLLGGLAMLAFSLWCRAGRNRAARWWRGSETGERAVLLVVRPEHDRRRQEQRSRKVARRRR